MSDTLTMGGRIVVVDHAPNAVFVDKLTLAGFSCRLLGDLDSATLHALSNVDAVIVASDHPRAAEISALAPVVWLARGSPLGPDVIHDPPEPAELRALHWLATAAQNRRAQTRAESDASDASHLSELGKVVTTIAHEIRNPLTALSAKLQWLKRKAEGLKLVADTSDSMLDEVHRLSRMLNEVLEFGRSRTYSKRTSTEVGQTLNEVVALYRETCEQARVHLVVEPGAAQTRVPFPAEELHQVFQNLLTNAIDATPPDETIRISVDPLENGRLRVEFKNPGHLPEDIQQKAFELFFTTKPNGTGLGLPIVKRIVAGVSGEIEALNVGDFVVIRLTLPTAS